MRLLLTLTLIGLIVLTSTGQGVKPKRETLGSTGGSNKQKTSKIYILQSVGQASVIGSYSNKNRKVRQGFIQPLEKGQARLPSTVLMLMAYPNPTEGKLTLEFQDEITKAPSLTIYDLRGKVMKTETGKISQQYTTDIGELQPGIYFIEIVMAGKTARLKIFKK